MDDELARSSIELARNQGQMAGYAAASKLLLREEISIDDLFGYKVVASSSDVKTGMPIAVFQVILFTDQLHIIMQGLVDAENKKVFLAEFNTMAESFKRKQK